MYYKTTGYQVFKTANYSLLLLISLGCLFPIIHILAMSLSSSTSAPEVIFWPKDFTLEAYKFVIGKPAFTHSIVVTLERVLLGTLINMLLTLITAYPLAKEVKDFRFRTVYAWVFVITILFSGGLIPWYLSIRYTGLMDSIWALVIPSALPVFNVILLLNFFRGLPKELEESAFMDGASHWTSLLKIFIPLSLPALATVMLFTMVGHWNSWFDGLILMNKPEHYPLTSYLQTQTVGTNMTHMNNEDARVMAIVSDRTAKAAQIFIGALPIMLVYPFLQKYFISGIVLGSVKE